MEMTCFTIVINKIKHLGVTPTKQVKHLYDKNFNSLKKEFEELRRRKDCPCSWISRSNSKNGHLSKSNLQIQCNPHQNFTQFFTVIWRVILNFIQQQQQQQNRIVENVLKNNRTSGKITIPDLKVYYRAIVVKNDMVLVHR